MGLNQISGSKQPWTLQIFQLGPICQYGIRITNDPSQHFALWEKMNEGVRKGERHLPKGGVGGQRRVRGREISPIITPQTRSQMLWKWGQRHLVGRDTNIPRLGEKRTGEVETVGVGSITWSCSFNKAELDSLVHKNMHMLAWYLPHY